VFIITHNSASSSVLNSSASNKSAPPPSIGNSARLGKIPELYTRSRDALKSIRVDGWFYDISSDKDGVDCYADRGGANLFEALEFKTEELAELWVIINTIEWSRDND